MLLAVWAMTVISVNAQRITVSAPSRVAAGENFRVAYTITTQDVDDFRSNMRSTDEVEIIAGPYTSKMSSISMVNGHTSSTSSVTYTYTLYANKAGVYKIPPAHAKINGRSVASTAVKIVISGHARGNTLLPGPMALRVSMKPERPYRATNCLSRSAPTRSEFTSKSPYSLRIRCTPPWS